MKVICVKKYKGKTWHYNKTNYKTLIIKKGEILDSFNTRIYNDNFMLTLNQQTFDIHFMTLDDYRNNKLNIILDESNLY